MENGKMADYFTEREKIEAEYAATNTVIADYISRQAAIYMARDDDIFVATYYQNDDYEFEIIEQTRDAIAKRIEELPSADVQPVVHGHWVKNTDDGINAWWWECSECGDYPLKSAFGHDVLSEWCPYCGARMDEGSE